MRYLITWTSPIVFHKGDENESIGVYGVEGSKPGAAPAGAFLSHEVIGLHRGGYGLLLGEAMFTCTKVRNLLKAKGLEADEMVIRIALLSLGDHGHPTKHQGEGPKSKFCRRSIQHVA